jgi:D-glucuronyl C5-epimerase C-terminus
LALAGIAPMAVLIAGWVPSARATSVLVLERGGRVVARNDPFLPALALTPPPVGASPAATRGRSQASASRGVVTDLKRLRRRGAITATEYRHYRADYRSTVELVGNLSGTPATELGAVIANLDEIAGNGQLTASRLPALFLTLERNREWWASGVTPATYERVEFTGDQRVWEYYPGQGIELQVLGTFGKADGLYSAGRAQYSALKKLVGEMLPLAAHRGRGLTWEYYFHFDGGSMPWTSAMSQGTAIEALTRTFKATRDRAYLTKAHHALRIFTLAPSVGVAVKTRRGARYVQYTFAPEESILNAFLQSLIGLYDYARIGGDPLASRLFAAGDAEARAEVPRFDTGAWSLYQPGEEDSLSYHELVTGFLGQLCQRTHARVYCVTAQHFRQYLKTPPALKLLTHRLQAQRSATVRFRLSKYSHVGIVVLRGSRTVFETSAYFPYGTDAFVVPPLKRGSYTIHLAATDLTGNFKRIVNTLQVS